uniref:Nucleoporin_N domain-containing protein n=1 Tax=Rhabditophanes sp. KR3021 TaxID=114890 RepID=A0AC35UGT8_9BILA
MTHETSGFLGIDEALYIQSNTSQDDAQMNNSTNNPAREIVKDNLISDRDESDYLALFGLHNSFNPSAFLTTVSGINFEEEYVELNKFDIHEMVDVNFTCIPEELRDQLRGSSGFCAYGSFPVVCRSWMSIDNNFFIWQDDMCGDMAMFNMNSLIQHARLTAIPKEMFPSTSIEYMLVLVTTQEVVLIPLFFENMDEGDITDYRRTIINFSSTNQYSGSLDSQEIKDVAVTNEGRIFMITPDYLLEVDYKSKGWFRNRSVKLINHTKSFFSNLIPSMSFFTTKDEYLKITVDNSRGVIHILSQNGTIRVFSLGNDGKSIDKVAEMTSYEILHSAGKVCKIQERYFKDICAIVPIESTVSSFIAFMAVTTLGTRFYFGFLDFPNRKCLLDTPKDKGAIHQVVLAHIRLPPNMERLDAPVPDLECVYSAYSTKEATLVCYGMNNGKSTCVMIYSNMHYPFSTPLVESVTSTTFNGIIHSIEELTRALPKSMINRTVPFIIPKLDAPISCNVDDNSSYQSFKVITNKGIHSFKHVSPATNLQNFVQVEQFDSKKFGKFVSLHGNVNILVMTMQIICAEKHKNSMTKSNARKLFSSMHGEPVLVREQRARHVNQERNQLFGFKFNNAGRTPQNNFPRKVQNDSQQGNFRNDIIYSSAHDAAYSYFSRVIKELWVSKLIERDTTKEKKFQSILKIQDVQRVIQQLGTLLEEIEVVPTFLRNFKPLEVLRDTNAIYSKQGNNPENVLDQNYARQKEQESMIRYVDMVKNTYEFLQVWCVFMKNNLHIICNQLPDNLKNILENSKLHDVVFDKSAIIKKMVRGLIRMHLKDNASVTVVSSELRKLCPTLFSQDDYKLLKAEEIMREAKNTIDLESKEASVQEAIKILLSTSIQIDVRKCVGFIINLKFYKQAVQFAMLLADKFDSGGLSNMFIENPINVASNMRVLQAVDKVNECYDSVSEVLEKLSIEMENKNNRLASLEVRDDILLYIFKNASQAGMYRIYEGAVDNQNESLMKCFPVDKFRDYLLWKINFEDSPTHFEKLLDVQRHATNGHAYMAKLLYDKAINNNSERSLEIRIFWLSQAMVFIQSSDGKGAQIESMMVIKEALECAEVQHYVSNELQLWHDTKLRLEPEDDKNEIEHSEHMIDELNSRIWPVKDVIAHVTDCFRIPLANLVVYNVAVGTNTNIEEVESVWEMIIEDCFFYYKVGKESSEETCTRIINVLRRANSAPSMTSVLIPKTFIIHRLIDFFVSQQFKPIQVIRFCINSELSLESLCDAISYSISDIQVKNDKKQFQKLEYLLSLIFALAEAFVNKKLNLSNERRSRIGSKLSNLLTTGDLHAQQANIKNFIKYVPEDIGNGNPFIYYLKDVESTVKRRYNAER